MRATQERIANQEDKLALSEYGIEFGDLPGSIKQNIHNAVLEEFGLRKKFQFTCLDCGKSFEEMVEGGLVEIYTDIQSETHTVVLESSCPECRRKKELLAEQRAEPDTPEEAKDLWDNLEQKRRVEERLPENPANKDVQWK